MEIIKLSFKKNSEGKTDLNYTHNLESLFKYILPIIEVNEGWGTKDLTAEAFKEDPKKFQDDIDATVWDNVHVLLDENKPIALLEFERTYIRDLSKKEHSILNELLGDSSDSKWNALKSKGWNIGIDELIHINSFLSSQPIYSSIGIVISTELQGQKSGISEMLYEIISDGINFGWTSNPVIVRQRRKLFKNTLYFPMFEEHPKSIEELSIAVYLYAYLLAEPQDKTEGLEFGALHSNYFVEQRGEEYLKIAQEMASLNKIELLDLKRIQYVLSKKRCAGAIISWN